MKRFRLKSSLAVAALLAMAVVAWAFYATTGTGSGSGGTTGTITPATISVPATSSGTHAVDFDVQATLSNTTQNSQIKYTVQRKLDSGSFADVPSGDCSGQLDHGIASCTDIVGTSGDYMYQVIATYKGWSATSAAAGPVKVTVGGGDTTAPTVSSIDRAGSTPTNAGNVQWTVTFSENVSGVDAADFDLVPSGLGGSPAITNVTGNNATYTVTASTGTGDGTVGLDLDDDDSIEDAATNKLGGTGVDNGDFTGQVYTIDRTAPTAFAVNRADANPTNASSVSWTVTFSEDVTGVDSTDFTVVQGGGVSGASITSVTPSSGPENVYTVTANTGNNSGTLGLNLLDDNSIVDGAGNTLNGTLTGQVYTIDKTAPTVSSITRTSPTPTNDATVSWTVGFSESVSGVTAADFDLVVSGLGGTPAITNVTPAGPSGVYTVTASTGTGDGTLGLDLDDDDSIADALGQKLGGTGVDNGDFTGQVYTLDRTVPTVLSINRVGSSPTNASVVSWTVTFSENVTGVNSDFVLVATGLGGSPSITSVSGSNATYTVTASTGSGSGTLGLDLDDNDSIVDDAGNALGGTGTIGAGDGSFVGQVYALDRTAPQVTSINRVGGSPTNTAGNVSWTVVFTEPVAVAQVTSADFDLVVTGLTGTPAIGTVTAVSPSGGFASSFTVTASTGTGSGSLGLDLDDDDSIVDSAGNVLVGPSNANGDFVGQVYAIDRTAPQVTSINRFSLSPTNASSVRWTVVFTEPVAVANVTSADFDLVPTGLGGTPGITAVTAVSPSGGFASSFTVDASTGTGDGSLGLDLDDDDSIVDAAGNALVGPSNANGDFVGQVYAIDRTIPVSLASSPATATSSPITVTYTASDAGGSNLKEIELWVKKDGGTATNPLTDLDPTTTQSFAYVPPADGTYEFYTRARDNAGNYEPVPSPVDSTTVYDATRPTGTAVDSTNGDAGATGNLRSGDTLILTFSEAIKSTSISTAWTNPAVTLTGQSVIVKNNTNNDTIEAVGALNIGVIQLQDTYVTADVTFQATLGLNAARTVLTITFGTPSSTTSFSPRANPTSMIWTPDADIEDLLGNDIVTTAVTEAGNDRDF